MTVKIKKNKKPSIMLSVFKNGTSMQYFWSFRPIHIMTVIFVSQSESKQGIQTEYRLLKSQIAIQVNFPKVTFGEKKKGGEK